MRCRDVAFFVFWISLDSEPHSDDAVSGNKKEHYGKKRIEKKSHRSDYFTLIRRTDNLKR